MECPEYYPNTEILFMNLANIHSIRKSFQALRLLCNTPNDQVGKHYIYQFLFTFYMTEMFVEGCRAYQKRIQIPTPIPEKIVVALFSGFLVNSGMPVVAGRLHSSN